VNYIPRGALLPVSSSARIVVPKAVNLPVPEWHEHLDKQGFRKWNPDVVNDKKSATEVIETEILRFADGSGVFGQSLE
jgi:hypothetical protein